MARRIPEDRLSNLLDAATATFVARGYRLTQMSDVAEALGVGKGTLYGYVTSKEALFDAVVRYADRETPLPDVSALPLSTPSMSTLVEHVRARLEASARSLELTRVVADPGARVTRACFEIIVHDLFSHLHRERRALKVLDRCAADVPELAEVWFGEGRWEQVSQLERLFTRGIASGDLHSVESVPLAARMVLELIATWAIHIPWDPAPKLYDHETVERAVTRMLVNAYTKERTP